MIGDVDRPGRPSRAEADVRRRYEEAEARRKQLEHDLMVARRRFALSAVFGSFWILVMLVLLIDSGGSTVDKVVATGLLGLATVSCVVWFLRQPIR